MKAIAYSACWKLGGSRVRNRSIDATEPRSGGIFEKRLNIRGSRRDYVEGARINLLHEIQKSVVQEDARLGSVLLTIES